MNEELKNQESPAEKDQQSPAEKDQEPSAEEFDFPLPPASFEWLVLSLSMQGEMQLGHIRLRPDEQPKPNLKAAQHTIDLLAILQEKTKGNLTMEEERLLGNTLTELRFRYVEAAREHRQG